MSAVTAFYLRCNGTTPPTIVYMHGSISETDVVPHTNGAPFLSSLGDEHRVCVYDRRNLGRSDPVNARQRPKDALNDMRRLLGLAVPGRAFRRALGQAG